MTTPDGLPDLTRPLRQPSWPELRALARTLSFRQATTPLERVIQEVGEDAYAIMLGELMDMTFNVRGPWQLNGLEPDLYRRLLQYTYRHLRAAEPRRAV